MLSYENGVANTAKKESYDSAFDAVVEAMNSQYMALVEEDIELILGRNLPWERLSGAQVVVTGAAGFLGGYLTRTLLKLHMIGKVSRPIRVIAIVRDRRRAYSLYSDLLSSPYFELFDWDFNNLAVPELGSVQFILHAASQASPKFYGRDPVGTILPNTVGTAALLEVLRRSPDPQGFLFISSGEVYGGLAGEAALSETDYGIVDPTGYRACYAESKRMGEAMCVAWLHQYAIPAYIVRPFHTYGPGLKVDDGRVFADFVFNIVRSEDIAMESDGMARRAFCYVTDAIAGFFTVLLKGKAGVPYNVSNPSGEMSVVELGELLCNIFPEKQLKLKRSYKQSRPGYIESACNRLVPDVSRLEALGWKADISPAKGFKRMIEAYVR